MDFMEAIRERHSVRSYSEKAIDGEVKAQLLEALAPLPVTDLTITEPDLEETFLHFYAEGKAAR